MYVYYYTLHYIILHVWLVYGCIYNQSVDRFSTKLYYIMFIKYPGINDIISNVFLYKLNVLVKPYHYWEHKAQQT